MATTALFAMFGNLGEGSKDIIREFVNNIEEIKDE